MLRNTRLAQVIRDYNLVNITNLDVELADLFPRFSDIQGRVDGRTLREMGGVEMLRTVFNDDILTHIRVSTNDSIARKV